HTTLFRSDTDLLLSEAVAKLLGKAGTDKDLTDVLIDFALEKADEDKSWDLSIDLNKIGKLLFLETHIEHLKKLVDQNIGAFLELKGTINLKIKKKREEAVNKATE